MNTYSLAKAQLETVKLGPEHHIVSLKYYIYQSFAVETREEIAT